jgi:hypothetical protein
MKLLILALSASTMLFFWPDVSDATTCYKKVGGACVSSATGSMDSTCTKSCAVAKKPSTSTKQKQKSN